MPKTPKTDTVQDFKPAETITAMMLTLVLLAGLWYSGIPKVYGILIALVVLIISGEAILSLNNFPRVFRGAYMARSKIGLGLMDRLAKNNRWFWEGLADWGLVLGFGIFSVFLFKKDISKKTVALGVFSILFILIFILPYTVLPFAYVNIYQITDRIRGLAPASPLSSLDIMQVGLYALSVAGGFVLYTIASLFYGAALAVYGILLVAVTALTSIPNYSGLGNSIPGVAPIIPGITIPLIPGLLAFALLLIVHEFSHGILARIEKIKIKSSGILAFGLIPIGAFVEPDEKAIGRLSGKLQNRISAAGISANMLLCLIMFIPMFIMFYTVMPHTPQNYMYISYVVPNSPAYLANVVPGSAILKWNGYNISGPSDIVAAAKADKPNSAVGLVTNTSTYSIIANRTGKIGVGIDVASKLVGPSPGPIISFLYAFFALSFLLNFLIAAVNLLPIPSFDGWRIFNTSIKNKKTMSRITWLVILLFVLNALPWIWNL